MFLSTASLIDTSRIRLSPFTTWPGVGEKITIAGAVVSDTQTDLVALLLVLLVRSVMDKVTATGFPGSVVKGALKPNVESVPVSPVVLDQPNWSDFPPAESVLLLAFIETTAPFGLLASTQPRAFNGFSSVILGVLITGTSELKRIWPNKAGTTPEQCCSKLAANWVISPLASRTISSTSKRPVKI